MHDGTAGRGTVSLATVGPSDESRLAEVLRAVTPWAPSAAVTSTAAELASSDAPAVRRDGHLTAVLGGEAGWAPFGTALGYGPDLALIYAEVAEQWVADGITTHIVNVPVGFEEPWFDLSFGRQQAYALGPLPGPVTAPDGVEVARVGPEARDQFTALGDLVARYQALSPVFSRASEWWFADLKYWWSVELADENARCWMARRDGEPVGIALDHDPGVGLLAPADAVELSLVGVAPGARGTGVGAALVSAVVADAARRGAGHLVTDWRTTNLVAARYWPRWGLRPIAYRLVRTIDLTPFDR